MRLFIYSWRVWVCACALLLGPGSALADPPGSAPEPVAAARVLHARSLGEPLTLDWNRAVTIADAEPLRNLMEGLLAFDANLKLVPGLAKQWTQSVDGRTYVFELRSDVRWSDGTPLKAQQFVDSWKRLLAPLTGASYADLLFDVEGAEYYHKGALSSFGEVGIKAEGDLSLKITLKSQSRSFLDNLAMWPTYPIRQDLIDKYGSDWEKPGNLVTLGAYRLLSHDAGRNMVLERNPYYYGPAPRIEQVSIDFISDDGSALQLYDSGALDLLPRLSSSALSALSHAKSRKDLVSYSAYRTVQLTFNVNRYPLSILGVRRAIALAIDRSKFEQFTREGYPPARSLLPPGFAGGGQDISPAFDPAKARSLLTAAGFAPGRKLRLEVGTTDFDYLIALSDFVKSELKRNLGIDLVVRAFDVKDYSTMLMGAGQFGLILHDFTAKNPDSDHLMAHYLSKAVNGSNWKDTRYDDLVRSARDAQDPAAREKIYVQAQRRLLDEEVVTVPLYFGQNWALVRGTLHGVRLNPVRGTLYREMWR